MGVCLCRKDTVREEEEEEGKRDSYDSDKDFLFPKLSLFLSLSLYSHIYTRTQDEFFPTPKGRESIALHCIALQNQDDRPARLILSLRMID